MAPARRLARVVVDPDLAAAPILVVVSVGAVSDLRAVTRPNVRASGTVLATLGPAHRTAVSGLHRPVRLWKTWAEGTHATANRGKQ